MCESCECIPCDVCGAAVKNGICFGCGEQPDNCECELLEEEMAYDEDEDFDDEDEEDFDDEDEEEEEEDFDDEDDEDW